MKTLSIIGCGNMVRSLFYQPLAIEGDWQIHCCSRTESRAKLVAERISKAAKNPARQVSFGRDNRQAAIQAEALMLGVKPYQAEQVCRQIKDHLKPDCHVLSLLAGVSVASLCGWLGQARISRLMPNTPTQVGLGMTAIFHAREVTQSERNWLDQLLRSSGHCVELEQEQHMHAATAISGSGPAYFMAFMQAMQRQAEEMGLSSDQAKQLIVQTCLGAGALCKQEGSVSFQKLCDDIGVQGSATAAALEQLYQGGLEPLVSQAMQACYRKSQHWQEQFQ